MNWRRRSLLLLMSLLALAAAVTVWKFSWPSEARQMQADFKWFSHLGFPEVKGLPYVRVATGSWSQSGDAPPENYYIHGFLLSSNAHDFTVFTLGLAQRYFTNSAPGTPEHKRVGFAPRELPAEAEQRLEELRNSIQGLGFWNLHGDRLPVEAEVFTLAWACWRQGHPALAQELYHEAERLPRSYGAPRPPRTWRDKLAAFVEQVKERWLKQPPPKPPLRETIERDIATHLIWGTVVSFGNPAISRPELLRELEMIVKNYPHSEHRERARQMAQVLKRMIAEDNAHAKVALTDLAQLPKEEQVRELIFRLRDQNGQQWSQPGWCDIFTDFRGSTNTPAHQLLALGYTAVPQLIAALDSDTLTRSVGYHRNFYFSHTVLTVGDCAVTILERISGKSFFVVRTTSSYMSKEGAVSPTRKAAEAWWQEFQQRGEQQMLIEGVKAGGRDAPDMAELLLQRYPQSAGSALMQGVRAATEAWPRRRLVEQLAKVNGEAAVAFLREEVVSGPEPSARVAAAFALRPHDRPAAIKAMIAEWQSLAAVPQDPNNLDRGGEGAIQFLASCDSPEAIAALLQDLGKYSARQRYEVVAAIGNTNAFLPGQAAEPPSAATLQAIESGLVQALEDTEARTGMSGTWYGQSFSDPRICDIAGWFLAQRWPDRYAFALSGSLQSRERQRVACLNTWRKAHQLPLVPVPPR